jgi:hypothetical protein
MTIVNMQIIIEHEGVPYIMDTLHPELEQQLLSTIIAFTSGKVPTIKYHELTAIELDDQSFSVVN